MADEDDSTVKKLPLDPYDPRPPKKARYLWQIKGRYRVKQRG